MKRTGAAASWVVVCVAFSVSACRNKAPAHPSTGPDGSAGTPAADARPNDGQGGKVSAPPCPANPPLQGTACTAGAACEYGTDPRGRACRTYASCGPANTWNVSVPSEGYPSYCVPPHDPGVCPASVPAAQGQACTTDLSFCDLGGVPCACTACAWNGGALGVSCGTTLTWHCQTPRSGNSPNCPVLDPNLGATCDVEGLACNYYCGGAGRFVCQGGYWTPALADPCPV